MLKTSKAKVQRGFNVVVFFSPEHTQDFECGPVPGFFSPPDGEDQTHGDTMGEPMPGDHLLQTSRDRPSGYAGVAHHPDEKNVWEAVYPGNRYLVTASGQGGGARIGSFPSVLQAARARHVALQAPRTQQAAPPARESARLRARSTGA